MIHKKGSSRLFLNLAVLLGLILIFLSILHANIIFYGKQIPSAFVAIVVFAFGFWFCKRMGVLDL